MARFEDDDKKEKVGRDRDFVRRDRPRGEGFEGRERRFSDRRDSGQGNFGRDRSPREPAAWGDGERRRPPREGGGFSDRSERPFSPRGDDRSGGDRPGGGFARKSFGDRGPGRDFSGDNRGQGRFSGPRAPGSRDFSGPRDAFPREGRPPFRPGGGAGAPRGEGAGRPWEPRRSYGEGDRGPRREFSDRGNRFGDRPPREHFGDRPPRRPRLGDEGSFIPGGERRRFEGDRGGSRSFDRNRESREGGEFRPRHPRHEQSEDFRGREDIAIQHEGMRMPAAEENAPKKGMRSWQASCEERSGACGEPGEQPIIESVHEDRNEVCEDEGDRGVSQGERYCTSGSGVCMPEGAVQHEVSEEGRGDSIKCSRAKKDSKRGCASEDSSQPQEDGKAGDSDRSSAPEKSEKD